MKPRPQVLMISLEFFKRWCNTINHTNNTVMLSISIGTFCDACMISKLKPLLKQVSKTNPKNYCHISLPPLESKVLERVIQEQTMIFLIKHKTLYKFQSVFQQNHSTHFCLSYYTDKILNGFNSGLLTGMILINF